MIDKIDQLLVKPDTTIIAALEAISAGAKQIVFVVDDSKKLLGAVTDGDIRRGLLRGLGLDVSVAEVMNQNPHVAGLDDDPEEVMIRENKQLIHNVPVVDAEGRIVGLYTDEDRMVAKVQTTPVILMAGGKGVRSRRKAGRCRGSRPHGRVRGASRQVDRRRAGDRSRGRAHSRRCSGPAE